MTDDERWPSRLPKDDKRIRHNHLTRDIKPKGQCPACDAYCRSGQPVEYVEICGDPLRTNPLVERLFPIFALSFSKSAGHGGANFA